MNPQDTLQAAKIQHDQKVAQIVSEVLEKYKTSVAYKGGLCHQIEVGGYYNHLAVSVISALKEQGWNVAVKELINDEDSASKVTIIILQPEPSSVVQ